MLKQDLFIERHIWKLDREGMLHPHLGETYGLTSEAALIDAWASAEREGYRVLACREIPSNDERYWNFQIQVERIYLVN
jgi:hypothetical protein